MGRHRRPLTTINTAGIKPTVLGLLLSFVLASSAFIFAPAATVRVSPPRPTATAFMSSASPPAAEEWSPLTDLLDAEPSNLCQISPDESVPRLAKDEGFALAVQNIWKEEITRRQPVDSTVRAVGKPITYLTSEGTPLYGYVVSPETATDGNLPGILLFHTGAGPQDIFLRWKAESLVTNPDIGGCVIMICDIISDDKGWAWSSDRAKYNDARKEVMESSTDANGQTYRPELQRRVQAAVDTLKDVNFVDSTRIASLGWCMGGHPCLELGRMSIPGMKAVVTFHGVFDAVAVDETNEALGASEADNPADRPCCLVCNGKDDPFVRREDLDSCKQIFEQNGWEWKLVQYERTRHGFTNPAQDLNTSEAFSFNEEASMSSWEAACDLMKHKLS